jgi:hypothetical protein
MTNAGREYEPAPVPVAMLTHEDYALKVAGPYLCRAR